MKPPFWPGARIAQVLSILVSAGLFALIAAELWGRLVARAETSGIAQDPVLGWRLLPGERRGARGIRLRFNPAGFRGEASSPERRPGVGRVLVLGDSYTAGLGVEEERTFVSIAARGTGLELLSAAVPAWATDQQLLYLESEGVRLKPDAVLVMMAPNDLREAWAKRFFRLAADGALVRDGPGPVPLSGRLAWWLANRSAGFQWSQARLGARHGSFAQVFEYYPVSRWLPRQGRWFEDADLFQRDPGRAEPALAEAAEAYRLGEALLRRIQEVTERAGARLYLSLVPTSLEYGPQLARPGFDRRQVRDWLRERAARAKVPFVELHPAFEAAGPQGLYFGEDIHFNEAGHAIAGERLREFLSGTRLAGYGT